jgi:PAS domain S-box-containing protein
MSRTATAYSNMRPPAPEDRSQRLIEKSGFGVFRSTLEGRFVDVNRALVEMLGYDSAEQLLAADAAQDIYRESEHRDWLIDDIRRGRALGWLELPWRKKSGVPITVRVTVDSVRDDDGTICWLDGLVEDLTEQRRHDEVVRRNERMASLGKMLAGVAVARYALDSVQEQLMVHGIITAYGGAIDVETRIGQGTRFVVKVQAGEPLPAVASGS